MSAKTNFFQNLTCEKKNAFDFVSIEREKKMKHFEKSLSKFEKFENKLIDLIFTSN